MADIKEEIKDTAVTTSVAAPAAEEVAQPQIQVSPEASKVIAAPAVAEELDPAIPPHKKSKGEKVFDWLVYSGINYWANLGISLVLIDFFKEGKGSTPLKGITEKTANLFGKTGMTAERANNQSKLFWDNVAYPSGGWVILAPMKWMEDNKRKVVYWLNEKLGVDQKAPDGHEMTSEEIYLEKKQPFQTWPKVLARRALATVAVWGSSFAVNNTVGSDNVTNTVKKYANQAFDSGYVPGGKWMRETPWFQRYLGYAALDTVFTKITAMVMHMTNGAGKGKEEKEIDNEDSPLVDDKSVDNLRYLSTKEDRKFFADEAARQARKDRLNARFAAKKPQESFTATVQQQNAAAAEAGLST